MIITRKSILVLGATGRTGLECIKSLANHSSKPQIHAFCRDTSKLADAEKALCSSVVVGNAKSKTDIERALQETKADVVIVSVGNGDNVAKSDIRTASAKTLADLMKQPSFEHLKVVVVSSAGAGSSKIVVGMGIGTLISYHLRHALKDHTGQELAFASPELNKRACVVRASSLTDKAPTGKLVTYGDREKAPTIETTRADLADWIAKEICDRASFGGKVVNLTGAKI